MQMFTFMAILALMGLKLNHIIVVIRMVTSIIIGQPKAIKTHTLENLAPRLGQNIRTAFKA